jgi:hypothetical protein
MSRYLLVFAWAFLLTDNHLLAHDGPHGGVLYCNSKHTHHAELCLDAKTGTATIYVLDARADKEVPVPSDTIPIDLKGFEDSKLEFKPLNQKDGKASRYALKHDRFKKPLKPSEMKIYILLHPDKALTVFKPEHDDD